MMRPIALIGAVEDRIMGIQGWGGMMDGWWGVHVIWMLFWIALLVLVVAVIWRLFQGRPAGAGAPEESPLEILKRRYARGEIDRDEFEAKKRDLGYG